jgi:hypothetical protein
MWLCVLSDKERRLKKPFRTMTSGLPFAVVATERINMNVHRLTVLDSRYQCPIARNLMIALVAGGGFEPPTFGL